MTGHAFRKLVAVFSLAALVILPCAPGAAEAPMALTEAEAVELALKHSRDVSLLEQEVKAQEKVVKFAPYEVNNPEIRMQDISTDYLRSDVNDQFEIGLRWQPPRLGELGEREQKERVTLWEKKLKAQERRLEVIAEVRKVCAELILLKDYADLAEQAAARESARLDVVGKLVALGQSSLSTEVKARVRVQKARRDAAQSRQRYRLAQRRLTELTGREGELSILDKEPDLPEIAPAALKKLAGEKRGEPELFRQRAEYARKEYWAERLRLVPWFSVLELSYHYEKKKPDWGELMIGIELPLFNWNLGRLDATAIRRKASAGSEAAALEVIDRDLSESLAKYEEERGIYLAIRDDTERSIAETEKLLQEARKQALPTDEVLDMEITNLDLRMTRLDALLSAVLAKVELMRAAGIENRDDLAP